MRKLIWILVAIPAAIVFVTLGVANRHDVRLILDPFNPTDPALSLDMPFFVFLFAALLVGIVLGGMAAWIAQGRWRKAARRNLRDANQWRAEADRLARERDSQAGGSLTALEHIGASKA